MLGFGPLAAREEREQTSACQAVDELPAGNLSSSSRAAHFEGLRKAFGSEENYRVAAQEAGKKLSLPAAHLQELSKVK